MSKKKIVFIVLLLSFVIANVVLYLIFKEQYLNTLKDGYELLNKPLPIVGFTSAAVLFFLWKIIITSRYGEIAVNKIERKYNEKNENYEKIISVQNKIIARQDEKIDKLENYIIKICDTMTNKKIKEIGQDIKKDLSYGEERINSEAETN